MNYSNIFVIIFLASTVFSLFLDQALEFLDYYNRLKNGRKVPKELSGIIVEEKLKCICAYEDAKYVLQIPESILYAGLSLLLVCGGVYAFILKFTLQNVTQAAFFAVFLFALVSSVPGKIVSLPFELYREFSIEKRFGFSVMTFKMWVLDRIKDCIVQLCITALLLAVMTLIFSVFRSSWWIFLAAAYICISLLISLIYPLFIAPLFNKFTALPEGELKDRLEKLLAKCAFKAKGLFVMDASRRSRHSNAYFTGFGNAKRVVLYDTLIKQLSPQEIEAVLAHELGHYKKHHIVKRLCIMIPLVVLALFAAYRLSLSRGMLDAFGFSFLNESYRTVECFAALFLLGIIFGGFGSLLGAAGNYFSRKDEFEADAFAAKICGDGKALSDALIKLNMENMSEISVPRIYSVFNYNHPPLLERLRALGYKGGGASR
ncbi:M48 family metallopeptidase [Treponema parvum]|uniref:M48 family metallopeptidase n=1 Tax=Treponema parvum TaxID=138851 RepID=A0A975IBR4_9SPIR|nr:M48 family metallopeptidase [Treponema parvum]QTQ10992.1 M48 family metallopeptidase [Treponema parvum]